MAFGIKREELRKWKSDVEAGKIAILTHYWLDDRFPDCDTVTKVGCQNLNKLIKWGNKYNLDTDWIHRDEVHPHFDLFGERQLEILMKEGKWEQIQRFRLDHQKK